MFSVKRLCKADIVDNIVDDITKDSKGNILSIVCHSDIGLALNIQSGVADVGQQLNDLLLKRISSQPETSGMTDAQVDKVSDISKLVDFAQTRWCQFQSDKKAWMEHLISERDKRLAEIADKKKAEEEKQNPNSIKLPYSFYEFTAGNDVTKRSVGLEIFKVQNVAIVTSMFNAYGINDKVPTVVKLIPGVGSVFGNISLLKDKLPTKTE